MHTEQIGNDLFLIDLHTAGYAGLFSAYVLKGSMTTIIDPGPSSSMFNLLSGLREAGIQPEDVAYVALSHVHVDHSGCTGTLLRSLPNAKILIHPRGRPHLVNPEKLWISSQSVLGHTAEVFGKPDPVAEDRIISASDGQEFEIEGDLKLRAVETLGHAAHHLSFFISSCGILFSGDAAGVYFREFDAVVPTSPPPFYPGVALDSLQKLIELNPVSLCYAHFGKVDRAVARLENHAAQIRLWLKIAENGIRGGETADSIRESLFCGDKTVRSLASYLKSHPLLKTTLFRNSCDGFIEFARKTAS